MKERLRYLLVGWMALITSGCSIASRSDSFGAEGYVRVGGLLSYVVDIEAGFKIGFYRQQQQEFSQSLREAWYEDNAKSGDGSPDFDRSHYL